ncbi:fasciclin domain-containing protein [Cellulophaga baltica]|uniref:fasciclin domain-containing protein n=1 Tax=Cellulophaga TaxID=104264 RepID=UPI001C06E732|nr:MULTISPECIES: fasciclin domain-containing protein [Cellulophaga]MBU2996071.1 fasciclin domain-containing protein [Cellulophaga baltica]MDO6767466.1 fasciclin domain-containing protein [Cellulophaga sp. 1_MG-2023]
MKFFLVPLAFITLLFSTTNAQAQSTKMDPQKSIISNAEASGNHDLLLAAVKLSDLETTLDNEGPYTVFAPSDVNFDQSTKKRVTELIRLKNKKELQTVIGYHIVPGNITASKILKALCRGKGVATFTTITGDKLTATMNGLDIVLTDKNGNQSTITKADANQCNGVIHEIDNVHSPIKA